MRAALRAPLLPTPTRRKRGDGLKPVVGERLRANWAGFLDCGRGLRLGSRVVLINEVWPPRS